MINIPRYKDFPKPGINFINTVEICNDPIKFKNSIDWFTMQVNNHKDLFALDARGFIWGSPVALLKGLPFHVIRKQGKLPGNTYKQSYKLEYGEDTIEINNSVPTGNRKVLIVDDLVATGGTLKAACNLLHNHLGIEYYNITCVVLVNLTFLNGTKRLEELGVNVRSCINEV